MNMKCVCVQKIKIPIFHDKNLLNAILMSFNFFFFFLGGGGGPPQILAIDVHCHTRSVSCLSIEKRF
jgi:hypothetical protein